MSRIRSDDIKITMQELERAGVYKRFQGVTFETMGTVPASVHEQYTRVRRYADNLQTNLEQGIGLLLKGGVGTMKTTLAIAVLRENIKRGGNGFFIPMVNMLDNIFTMKARNKDEWLQYEERIKNTQLLVLDDLGAEYHQDWVLSKVDAIVNERYNRMKPVIITTNQSDAELKGKYAERVIDRLRSTVKVINFGGSSLRKVVG